VRWDIAGNSRISVMVPDTSKLTTLFEYGELKVLALDRYPVCKIDNEKT